MGCGIGMLCVSGNVMCYLCCGVFVVMVVFDAVVLFDVSAVCHVSGIVFVMVLVFGQYVML